MIEIRQTGLPESGNSWSCGRDHMRGISAASARKLCGLYPTPQAGYETIVAIKDDGFGGKYRLCVQNISGAFYLASTAITVERWPDVFQVKIIEPSGEARHGKQARMD